MLSEAELDNIKNSGVKIEKVSDYKSKGSSYKWVYWKIPINKYSIILINEKLLNELILNRNKFWREKRAINGSSLSEHQSDI
jgi:hypothetical protein